LEALTLRRLALGRWALQILATLGFIALALLRVEVDEVWAALGRANYLWAGAALSVLTLSKLLAAARWQLYLSDVGRAPLFGLMNAYVIGTFLNTVLPFRAGDFAKIQIVGSRYGLSRAGLTSSVFVVEGVLDLVTLLGLLLVGLAFLGMGFVPAVLLWPLVFLSGGAFAVALLASHLFPREMPGWRLPTFIPEQLRNLVQNAWPGFLNGLATLRGSRALLKAFSLHLLEWMMRVATLWLFALSFNLGVPLSAYVVLTVALSVFTLFPVTFMNIGTYQVIATEVLGAAGAPRSEAFAFAVTAQALSHAWVAIMGLAAIWLLHVRPRELIATIRQRGNRSSTPNSSLQ
jgi:glycosyltransferase 2 family protein